MHSIIVVLSYSQNGYAIIFYKKFITITSEQHGKIKLP